MHLSDLDELPVIGARGKSVGRVSRALFSAEEPVLVGFEVRMNAVGHVLERPRRYVAVGGVELTRKAVTLADGVRLEKVTGGKSRIEWEETVIWTGMPVRTVSGTLLGEVKDAELDAAGRVQRITLTRGATSDVAVGTREVPGEYVLGFSGGAVRVDDAVSRPEFSGGLAASAGRGAAVAKVTAEQAARGAVSAATAAARVAKKSGAGKRAAASWKGFAKGFKEGLRDDDEAARR